MAREFNLKSFLIATLRRATYRYPPRYNTMNKARVERGKYLCTACKSIVGRKEVKLDHIKPIVDPKQGFVDWNTYIERMFVDESGWQVLCNACHKAKSAIENEQRKKVKKKMLQKPTKTVKISKRIKRV